MGRRGSRLKGVAQKVRDTQGAPQCFLALLKVRALLVDDWRTVLAQCDLVFLSAAKTHNALFFSGPGGGSNAPFSKADPRVRRLPFGTQKPTFAEVVSAHGKLARLELEEGGLRVLESAAHGVRAVLCGSRIHKVEHAINLAIGIKRLDVQKEPRGAPAVVLPGINVASGRSIEILGAGRRREPRAN